MTKGRLITVEGGDGAGKTTHLDYLEDLLKEAGIDYVRTREPGGTAIGEKIRDLILKSDDSELSDQTELLLIFATRMEHIHSVINPALRVGKWVLCDRFTDATYAYQGGGRGIDLEKIARLEEWVQEGLTPDLTMLLDLPVEMGFSRTLASGGGTDRFEKQTRDFKEAVRAMYLTLASNHPIRIKVIDSNQSIKQVQRALRHEFLEFLLRVNNR